MRSWRRGSRSSIAQYSFAVYALATQGVGARAIVVPAVKYGHDLDAMLAAITDDTRLVFVANPNNPTGTFIEGPKLEAFLDKVPRHVAVVLDEAYTEYLPAEKRYDSIAWVRRYPNLLVSRTFSKAFGLAGLRVGFAIAQPELTDLLNRLRQPFNVNTLAQAAAIAALNDKAFLEKSAALNAQGYRRLTEAFDKLGLEYVPSDGNFVLVRVGDDARGRQPRQPRIAQAGRDRASGRQLRFAAMAAHHDRPAGRKRSVPRGARKDARHRVSGNP